MLKELTFFYLGGIVEQRVRGKEMKKVIYDIDKNGVLDIIEKYDMRFRVVLDKRKDLLEETYGAVPSWLRFQVEMKSRGKGVLLAEIEDIDNTYLLDRMQNEVIDALADNDSERLKAIQLATQTLVNKEKLGGSVDNDEVSSPIAMTVNVSGVSGKKEK